MEIDITDWLAHEGTDTWLYSGSIATHGADAGRTTWANAVARAGEEPQLLASPDELEACRDHMRGFGAWSDDEIKAWSDDEVRALFIQLVSGDLRELQSLHPGDGPGDVDWQAARPDQEEGVVSSSLYIGDIEDRPTHGRVFYYLGR